VGYDIPTPYTVSCAQTAHFDYANSCSVDFELNSCSDMHISVFVVVQCTYKEVEMPLKPTNAVVLSQPAGSWGAEMGANDHAVSIGCSQIHTSDDITSGLAAQDLVRLVNR